jgi:hypothetical protein
MPRTGQDIDDECEHRLRDSKAEAEKQTEQEVFDGLLHHCLTFQCLS